MVVVSKVNSSKMAKKGSDGTTEMAQHRKQCCCDEFRLQYKTFKWALIWWVSEGHF